MQMFLISKSEPPAPREIMVDKKIWTDISLLSEGTGNSSNPEKWIPRKKKKMKSLAMSPPAKYLISNQDINTLGIKTIKVSHHD